MFFVSSHIVSRTLGLLSLESNSLSLQPSFSSSFLIAVGFFVYFESVVPLLGLLERDLCWEPEEFREAFTSTSSDNLFFSRLLLVDLLDLFLSLHPELSLPERSFDRSSLCLSFDRFLDLLLRSLDFVRFCSLERLRLLSLDLDLFLLAPLSLSHSLSRLLLLSRLSLSRLLGLSLALSSLLCLFAASRSLDLSLVYLFDYIRIIELTKKIKFIIEI